MFKNKFKKMIGNTELSHRDFEIIKDAEALAIIGGCATLQYCGTFTGSCPDTLSKCNKFKDTSHPST